MTNEKFILIKNKKHNMEIQLYNATINYYAHDSVTRSYAIARIFYNVLELFIYLYLFAFSFY